MPYSQDKGMDLMVTFALADIFRVRIVVHESTTDLIRRSCGVVDQLLAGLRLSKSARGGSRHPADSQTTRLSGRRLSRRSAGSRFEAGRRRSARSP